MDNGFKKPELLSPAGSFDALKSAVKSGCDAVYVGGNRFGARAYADNFDKDTLLHAIDYMHNRGLALHLTVNTLLKEEEIERELYDYLLPFYVHGLDAVIVQDLGVFHFIRKHFPNLPIHVSTQMGVMSSYGAKLMANEGADRVVLARELNYEEVKSIREAADVEIEMFVHGALCYGYSGQCLLSSSVGGRSGNRGRCAQSCRLKYNVFDNDTHIFSPKDMCGLGLIDDIIRLQVDSLKIEGRMKSPDYVGVVTSVYRRHIDMVGQDVSERELNEDIDRLKQVFNRGGFNKGYLFSDLDKCMMSMKRPNHEGVHIGDIASLGKGSISFKALKNIYKGDIIELRDKDKDIDIVLTSPNDYKKGSMVSLNCPKVKTLKTGISLYRMKSESMTLMEIGDKEYNKIPLELDINIKTDERVAIKIRNLSNLIETKYYSETLVDKAIKAPVDINTVSKAFNKLGGTDYCIKNLKVDISDDAFIPVGALNELRRNAISELEEVTTKKYLREIVETEDVSNPKSVNLNQNYIYVSDYSQFELAKNYTADDTFVVVPYSLAVSLDKEYKTELNDIYIAFPHMFREGNIGIFENGINTLNKAKGFMIPSLDSLGWIFDKGFNKDIVIDDTLYAFNSIAYDKLISVCEDKGIRVTGIVAPVELTINELAKGDRPYIMTIYEKQRLMTTNLCVKKNMERCNKQADYTTITDRKGKELKVLSDCFYCNSFGRRNVIYSDIPTVLSKDDYSANVSASGYMIRLTDEDTIETLDVLNDEVKVKVNFGHRYQQVD